MFSCHFAIDYFLCLFELTLIFN